MNGASAAHVVGLLNPGRAGKQEKVDFRHPGPEPGHPWEDTV